MTKRKPKHTEVLIGGGVALVAAIVAWVLVEGAADTLAALIRIAAILGYVCVFLTSLSALYLRELTRYFGRPFIKTHHTIAVTGLVALGLHAFAIAWRSQSLAVFLPSFASFRSFLTLGGRPALWLIAIASLAALWRTSVGKRWRILHWLNYLAFFLGTAHALLIGSNFQTFVPRALALAMAAVLLVVFVFKRRGRRR